MSPQVYPITPNLRLEVSPNMPGYLPLGSLWVDPEGYKALARHFAAAAGVAPQEPSACIECHRQEGHKMDCSRPAPSPDREKLIADGRELAAQQRYLCFKGSAGVIERLCDALAAPVAVDEAKLAEAKHSVDSIHQIHGESCLCGFSSARSRSRTEHITGALAELLGGGER